MTTVLWMTCGNHTMISAVNSGKETIQEEEEEEEGGGRSVLLSLTSCVCFIFPAVRHLYIYIYKFSLSSTPLFVLLLRSQIAPVPMCIYLFNKLLISLALKNSWD